MSVVRPAGFWNRFAARMIDFIIVNVVIGTLSFLLYSEWRFLQDMWKPIDFLAFIYAFTLPILWSGYTIGRKLMGNRIKRNDGKKVNAETMFMREFIAIFVYMLTLGIGIFVSAFMIAFRKDKRAIHDLIAETYVTHEPPSKTKGVREPSASSAN
ncbi:RDD family protein [Halobacillus fulvus]|nr:RDD family protein [Halobacillus fulvus]